MSSSNIAPQVAQRLTDALVAATNVADTMEKAVLKSIRCCPNCWHFDKQDEACKLDTLRRRPPADIIAFGCSGFEQDIPF